MITWLPRKPRRFFGLPTLAWRLEGLFMQDTWLGLTGEDWHAIAVSAWISVAAVLLSLPFGIALGWLLAGKSFRGKAVVETIVNLPLVLPPVVTGLLLLYLLGRRGWLGSRLYEWFGWEIALTWRAA